MSQGKEGLCALQKSSRISLINSSWSLRSEFTFYNSGHSEFTYHLSYLEDVELNVHDTFPLNTESMVKKFKTNRPIIGVITMPIKGSNVLDNLNIAKDESHIGASFVKLIEGAGARVVPLIETFNNTMVKDLLKSINGVLLPGGSESIIKSNYQRISRLAFDYSIAMYKKGITWPIMGICRGFQMLMSMLHPKTFTVTPTDAYNLTLRLQLTDDAKKSRLLGRAPIGVRKVLTKEKITFNAHVNGITTQTFKKYKELKDMWRIISTNKDRNGREFISTFEGENYITNLL